MCKLVFVCVLFLFVPLKTDTFSSVKGTYGHRTAEQGVRLCTALAYTCWLCVCLNARVCVCMLVHTVCSTCNCQHTASGPCSTIRSFYDIWFTRAVREPCGVLFSAWNNLHLLCKKALKQRLKGGDALCVCVCVHVSVCVCVCMAEAEPGAESSCNTHDLLTHQADAEGRN